MKKSVKSVLAACAFAGASPAVADLVSNGGFDDGYGGSPQQVMVGGPALLDHWTVGGDPGAITWYGSGFGLTGADGSVRFVNPHSGAAAVNLGSADGSVRFVSQTFDTQLNQVYRIGFWVGNYGGNGTNPVTIGVSIVDGSSNTIVLGEGTALGPTDPSADIWEDGSVRFIGDGRSNTIMFQEIGGPLIYAGLDDVSITAAPEPTTWALALAGFAGLGLAGRRRARRMTPA